MTCACVAVKPTNLWLPGCCACMCCNIVNRFHDNAGLQQPAAPAAEAQLKFILLVVVATSQGSSRALNHYHHQNREQDAAVKTAIPSSLIHPTTLTITSHYLSVAANHDAVLSLNQPSAHDCRSRHVHQRTVARHSQDTFALSLQLVAANTAAAAGFCSS